MFPYPILSDNSEAQHFLFPFISLQRDDHSCWNFFVDLLRTSDFGAFQIASACSVICCSDFVIQERSFSDLREIRICEKIMDHDSDLLDAFWYHGGFFQTTAGVRSNHGRFIFWTFWVLLISSADSVYFCAFVLFWLEIRLITIFPVGFW